MKDSKNFEERDLGSRPMVVSVEEAANILAVSSKTIYRLIKRGVLNPIRALRTHRIPIAEIENLLRLGK